MTLGVGIVGCGNISEVYLKNAPLFGELRFVACADLDPEAAARQGERHGLAVRTVADLIASDDIDVVLNLTSPASHAEVSLTAIWSGKHVYSEKPLATTLADGERIIKAAEAKGVRIGCAPDTVLGPGVQESRRRIDAGEIGRPILGIAAVLSHGMEHWHPRPQSFFGKGAGPMLDMGPYYVAALAHLLGPVASVQAAGQAGFAHRTISAPGSADFGAIIPVETLTSVQALLQFESGAQVTFLASWDVWRHSLPAIELHGQAGSLRVPDPNWFGRELQIAKEREDWGAVAVDTLAFGRANWATRSGQQANYRGVGLAEMAQAIRQQRPHRANGEIALHVLNVLDCIVLAALDGRRRDISWKCARPQPFSEAEALTLISAGGS